MRFFRKGFFFLILGNGKEGGFGVSREGGEDKIILGSFGF